MSDQTPPPPGDQPSDGTEGVEGAPIPPPPSYPSYGDGGGDTPPPPSAPPSYGAYGGDEPAPGNQQQYSIGDAVSTGFRLFGKNAGPFVAMMFVILIAAVIFSVLSYVTSDHDAATSATGTGASVNFTSSYTPMSVVFSLLSSIVSTLLGAGLARGAIDAVDGKQVTFGAMFEGWDKVQVLIAALIVSVLTFIGLVLCVIPGLIVAFLLWYTNYFIVDGKRQAFEAVKDSFSFTSGNAGTLLLTAIVAFLINLVGAILCLVGLLVTAPATAIVAAVAYRQLQGRAIYDGR